MVVCSKCYQEKSLSEVRCRKGRRVIEPVICYVCLKPDLRSRGRAASARAYKRNPLKHRVFSSNSKAKRLEVVGTLDWQVLAQEFTGKCGYCETVLTLDKSHIDHIKPLSRGGTNEHSNVKLVCEFCNRAKGTVDLEVFLEWLNLKPGRNTRL